MMSRKDYEVMAATVFAPMVSNARILRGVESMLGHESVRSDVKAETVEVMAYNLVQALAYDNPRFDHVKFYEACGFKVVDNYPKV